MFKILMTVFSFTVFIFGLSLQAAQEIPVDVLSAFYNSQNHNIEVLVSHQNGGCDSETYQLKLRGCTDMVVPYKCFADLKGYSTHICNKDTFLMVPFSVEKLGLNSQKYKGSTLVIKGAKSQKAIILRN